MYSKILIACLVSLLCVSIAGGYLYFANSVLFNIQTLVGIFMCTLCLNMAIMLDSGKRTTHKPLDIYRLIS